MRRPVLFSLLLPALLAFALFAPAPARATAVPPPAANLSTWQFVGQCSDCTGTGVGTLVLQNYTPGNFLNALNFYSFSYSSNLVPSFQASIFGPVIVTGLSGFLTTAPGGDTLDISFIPATGVVTPLGLLLIDTFFASNGGSWCIGQSPSCGSPADFGPTNSISLVPEPASLALLGVGLAGLGAIRRRRAG